MRYITCIFILFFSLPVAFSQPFKLELTLTNLPTDSIIIGLVKGDRFIFLDSIKSEEPTSGNTPLKNFIYQFPKNSPTGVYRLMLGQTRYAQLMNESPQQLEFIFNNENIILKTDFINPEEKLEIINSEENLAWWEFKKKEKMYRQYLNQLRNQINSGQVGESSLQGKRDEYNIALMDREVMINETIKKYPALFASRIIKMYHEPVTDAYLSSGEGREAYINEYFNNLDFSDESLINSSIYTDKVIHFIQSFGQYGLSREQQELEFIKAVDIVFSRVNKNQAVYEFILDYIVRGFEKLNLNKALIHIAEKYGETTCQTDEKTTLERRLGFQTMKPGAKVPDFTLNDSNGDPVTLSSIIKPKTLILFWASWCPHCSEIIPELKQLSDQIQIIAVSIDSSKTEWQKKISEMGIEFWYNLSELQSWNGEITEKFNVYATPTLFLIDQDFTIIAKPYDYYELKSALERL